MDSTVAGELRGKNTSSSISFLAASIALLTAKATHGLKHNGGSPMHLEPKMPISLR